MTGELIVLAYLQLLLHVVSCLGSLFLKVIRASHITIRCFFSNIFRQMFHVTIEVHIIYTYILIETDFYYSFQEFIGSFYEAVGGVDSYL